MNNTIEPVTAGDVVKHSVIGFLIGSLVAILVAIFSAIIGGIARLPGLRMLRKANESELDSLASGIRKGSDLAPTITGPSREGVLGVAKADMVKALMEKGLSKEVSNAFVSIRDRLLYTPMQWNDSISLVISLLNQGYPEELITLHLRLTLQNLRVNKLDLLASMVGQGIEDMSILRLALASPLYDYERFERAIQLHQVHKLTWMDAFRRSDC